MSLDLNNLLASMQREGRLDSTGAFTIDLATAQAKLAKFTLPDSRAYILKMVQAAVAGGATELHLDSRSLAVEVRIHGLQLEQDGLELLLYRLAESGKSLPGATYHLAVGIQAALGLESKEISIVSRNGTTEKRVLWEPDSISHEVVESLLPAETILRFTRTNRRYWTELLHSIGFRGIYRLVLSGRDGLDDEQRLVNDICCQAPLRITINGARVPRLEHLPNPKSFTGRSGKDYCHIQEIVYPVTKSDGRGFLTPLNARNAVVMNAGPEHSDCRWRDFECRQIVGIHPLVPERQIMVILDGVLIKRSSAPGPGYTALISGHRLTTDLTGFQVVENDRYQEYCLELDHIARSWMDKIPEW
jgi:hypothetical protein